MRRSSRGSCVAPINAEAEGTGWRRDATIRETCMEILWRGVGLLGGFLQPFDEAAAR